MDNFFNYISKPIPQEDVDVLFNANNIISEKLELFSDFSHSLNLLVIETYLGEDESPTETKISLSKEDNKNHFDWCWSKTISNFGKEHICFDKEGDHYDYFKTFFDDVFYDQKDQKLRESIAPFFNDLFDVKKSFTKSDLDMIITIYKLLDKHMKKTF